jgi:hypothetical protein
MPVVVASLESLWEDIDVGSTTNRIIIKESESQLHPWEYQLSESIAGIRYQRVKTEPGGIRNSKKRVKIEIKAGDGR